MLKREFRLANIKKARFDRIFNSPYFTVRISKSGDKIPKFGFIVSKAISKSAVKRNRTKRVLSDAIKNFLNKMNKDSNVIIISKKELEFDQMDQVKLSLLDIFKKAEIIR